jgi:hypothetical protein
MPATIPDLDTRDVHPVEWEIEVSPGKMETFNGTIQDIYAKLQQRDDFVDPVALLDSDPTPPAAAPPRRKRSLMGANFPIGLLGMMAKWPGENPDYFCNGPWDKANLRRIREGSNYLRALKGIAHLPADTKTYCGRVSCSYNAAIFFCNDVSCFSPPQYLMSMDSGSFADGSGLISVENR